MAFIFKHIGFLTISSKEKLWNYCYKYFIYLVPQIKIFVLCKLKKLKKKMFTLNSISNNKKAGFVKYIYKNKQKIKFTYVYNFCKNQGTNATDLVISHTPILLVSTLFMAFLWYITISINNLHYEHQIVVAMQITTYLWKYNTD